MPRSPLLIITLSLLLCACSRSFSTQADRIPEPKAARTLEVNSSSMPASPSPTSAEQMTMTPKGPSPVIKPDNAMLLQNVANSSGLENPSRLAWAADGNSIGVAGDAGLEVVDAHTLTSLARVHLKQPINLVDFSLEKDLIATAQDHQTIDLRKLSTGELLRSISPENGFGQGVFVPGGEQLATTQTDVIAVDIWNTNDGSLQGKLEGFDTAAPTYQVVFSPDGKYMTWIARATAQVMEIASRKMGTALSHEDFIIQSDLNPSGSLAAVASAGTVDGYLGPLVQLWDPIKGEKIGVMRDEGQAISTIAFSADGRLLAVGDDQGVTLWDVAAQQPMAVLKGHEGGVKSLEFSPDGRSLATVGDDGILRLWQVVPQETTP